MRPGEPPTVGALAGRMAALLDPGLSWADVDWLRTVWTGPLLLKGILHPAEAAEAVARGIDGIIVSNHGGRQLDGAAASLDALPAVVEAVAGRMPVLVDGGIRRGADVVKALALGAACCLIGRPQLWGLAVAGEAGVRHVLELYRKEIDRVMALMGARSLATSGRIVFRSFRQRGRHMIEDPPLLTISRRFERPAARTRQCLFRACRLATSSTRWADAGPCTMRSSRCSPSRAMLVGVAVTCHCGPADNLAVFGAFDAAVSGDVIVAATDSFTGTAVTGDLVLGMARNKGVAGFVTDGLVRDIVGIEAVGLPVYCAGVIANSPARNGPGTVGFAVVFGGVTISPGDILVGDRDGVAVVPRLEAKTVLARLPPSGRPSRLLMPRCTKVWKCPTSLRPSSSLTGRASLTETGSPNCKRDLRADMIDKAAPTASARRAQSTKTQPTRRVVERGGDPNGLDEGRWRSLCCGGDRNRRGPAKLAQHKIGGRRVLTGLR